jgi:replicative DNA helicase
VTDHDELAERFILGAIILTGGRILEELEDFDPRDYYRPQHEELHRRLTDHALKNEPIDNASAGAACAAIRGIHMTYVLDLVQAVTAAAAAPFHAARVARLAALRRARAVGQGLAQLDPSTADTAEMLDKAVDHARSGLDSLTAARHGEVTTFADVADAAIDSIGQQQHTPTPWSGLDHLIRGWSPAHMYVIGARPGVGKTVLALQAAIDTAEKHQIPVAYYTFEMSETRLYQRGLAYVGSVDGGKLMDGTLSEAEWRAVSKADGRLRPLPFVVKGCAGWTVQDVVSHARSAHRRRPLGMVVVDHIGRIAAGEQKRTREQEIAESANRLLDLAHTLDASVLVLTQLNRESSRRSDPRPVLTDIRDSDVIEQNADCVILAHRDKEKTPHEMDLLVAKNRDGVEAPVRLAYEGAYSRAVDRPWRPSDAARFAS